MDLDFHSFGFLTSDISLEPSYLSGYLEDAIAGWNTQIKRQRNSFFSHENIIIHQDPIDDGDQFPNSAQKFSDDCLKKSSKIIGKDILLEMDSIASHKQDVLSSSTSSPISSISDENSSQIHASFSRDCSKKIAYPFEVVKPKGIEGDLTLQDINKKLLKRPTKPIKHPIGKCIDISSNGFHISGKTVLAITKIPTKGRGSITIIRTKD